MIILLPWIQALCGSAGRCLHCAETQNNVIRFPITWSAKNTRHVTYREYLCFVSALVISVAQFYFSFAATE
jgi:hypothetical protein